MPAKREPIEIGKRFGMLTIIEEAPDRILMPRGRARCIKVACDCGTIKTILYAGIHNTRSCGCHTHQYRLDAVNGENKPQFRLSPDKEMLDRIQKQEDLLRVGEFTPHEWQVQLTKLFTLTNQYLNK